MSNSNRRTPKLKRERCPAFYVPVNLDLGYFPARQRGCAAYLCNIIHYLWINWQADDAGFVHLKRRYLERFIPRPIFADVRNRLISMGVVECDGHYQPGSKSLGYRLGAHFRITKRIVCTDPALRRRIARLQRESDKRLSPVAKWLRGILRLPDIDLAAARLTIERMTPRAGSSLTDREYRELVSESVSRVAGGERDFTRDEYGRVHIPLTRLPRELRGCVKVHGESLAGIDLANSQPMLLGMLVAEEQGKQRVDATNRGGRQGLFLLRARNRPKPGTAQGFGNGIQGTCESTSSSANPVGFTRV